MKIKVFHTLRIEMTPSELDLVMMALNKLTNDYDLPATTKDRAATMYGDLVNASNGSMGII